MCSARIETTPARPRNPNRSGSRLGRSQNGKLLTLAQEAFDVFLTVDQNIPFQQNLPCFRIAVLVVPAASNDINDILPFVPAILVALASAKPGQATLVQAG